jgi:hypothetical protein
LILWSSLVVLVVEVQRQVQAAVAAQVVIAQA